MKPGDSFAESLSSDNVTRDRPLEYEVRGQDRRQPRRVERCQAARQDLVVGLHDLGGAGVGLGHGSLLWRVL